jgi:hypothetical protein
MVTTCRDIVTRAYRMAGGLRDQRRGLDATDASTALADLQMIVLSLPGMMHWTDVDTAVDYTAGENERVRVTSANPTVVTIPGSVSSARKVLYCCNQISLACDGYDDRAPKDGARVAVSDELSDTQAIYFYRSDIAQWTRADALTLVSECPLNADMDLYLAARLAGLLCAADAQPVPPLTAALITESTQKMRARYGKRQGVAVDPALLRTSSNPYGGL